MSIPTLILTIVMSIMPVASVQVNTPGPEELAVHEFSLDNRYKEKPVNEVFKDNILLTVSYVTGVKVNPTNINWDQLDKPFEYKFTLKPNETFAFHDDVLPNYVGKVDKTTNAHFNLSEGFKSDGYLVGDGICHLASILYWVAKDAGLDTYAPTRHDFAPVPEVPREYGVSIFTNPAQKTYSNQIQNLYITNNQEKEIAFVFSYDGDKLTVKATK